MIYSNEIVRTPVLSPPISSIHPEYARKALDWEKWQLAYECEKEFVIKYLKKLSVREEDEDFIARREITYIPAFAAAAIDDIRNSIFQRLTDVIRLGGPQSYQEILEGKNRGVDLKGSSIDSFLGIEVLTSLLVTGRVGILIDAPNDIGVTLADKANKRPFLAKYSTQQIVNWAPSVPIDGFTHLLLCDFVDDVDDFGFTKSVTRQWRMYRKVDNGVQVQFYDNDGKLLESHLLNISQIPFILLELPVSLMRNAADYQIALMNLESSDISFVGKANFPFYFEFYDPKTTPPAMKPPATADGKGTAAEATSRDSEIRVGLAQGRRFSKGLEKPGFINPDPDTLRVSMEKGFQIKDDIRLLVNLNLANMNPRRQSAESKQQDSTSLDAGLSFIGLVLQKAETEIFNIWDMFENTQTDFSITYPKSWKLKTDEERQAEADRLEKFMTKINSEAYRKFVAKKIVRLTAYDATPTSIRNMEIEIDNAPATLADPDQILAAHESGLVDDITASNTLGFDGKSVIEQARKDRAERIKLTVEAQGGEMNAARGVPEAGGLDSSAEKDGKRTRGTADKVRNDE